MGAAYKQLARLRLSFFGSDRHKPSPLQHKQALDSLFSCERLLREGVTPGVGSRRTLIISFLAGAVLFHEVRWSGTDVDTLDSAGPPKIEQGDLTHGASHVHRGTMRKDVSCGLDYLSQRVREVNHGHGS